jgi:hypothetical protein
MTEKPDNLFSAARKNDGAKVFFGENFRTHAMREDGKVGALRLDTANGGATDAPEHAIRADTYSALSGH